MLEIVKKSMEFLHSNPCIDCSKELLIIEFDTDLVTPEGSGLN